MDTMRDVRRAARLAVATAVSALSVSGPPAKAAPAGWRHDGTGCFPDARPPLAWSATNGIVWQTPLERSNAGPVVIGDRLFVCVEPATLVCLARHDGSVLWQRTNTYDAVLPPEEFRKVQEAAEPGENLRKEKAAVERDLGAVAKERKEKPDDEALAAKETELKARIARLKEQLAPLEPYLLPMKHEVTGYSSPTPAGDENGIYVHFGTGALAGYDLDGTRRWARVPEKPPNGNGHSASPLLAGGTLIVQIRRMHGLDPRTGETRWEASVPTRFGSPVHTRIGDADVVVTPGGHLVRAADGRILADKLGALTYAAPIVHDGIAYFIEHGGKAVRLPPTADGTTQPQPLWETKPPKERYYASAVYHEGLLYAIMQKSQLSAIDAGTGEVIYTQDVHLGGTVYPSLCLAGGYLFASGDRGDTAVFLPGREYKEVARNRLEPFRSTPVFVGPHIYVRGLKHVFCLGSPGAP